MKKYDIIIIGAGISGLSLALFCAQQGFKPLVLEKEDRLGGAFHSHRFSNNGKNFWLELGAHTCYNSYRNLITILEECRLTDHMLARKKVPFQMLVDDKVKSIFSQINLLEILLSMPRLFNATKKNQSVASYYTKILGKRNYQKVFRHVFDAVPSQKTNDFPAEMLFKKRSRRKDIMKNFTLTGGLQAITEGIAARPGIELRTGTKVDDIQCSNGLFRVTTSGHTYEAGKLALATPASQAAGLLHNQFPAISEKLANIKVAAVESVGVVVQKKSLSLKAVAGIVPLDDSFFSMVSRDPVPDNTWRGFTFHFKPALLNDEAMLKRIGEVLGVKPDRFDHVVTKRNFVPALRLGHEKLIKKIDSLLYGKPLLLTGNYFGGVSIEDCVSRSHDECNRFIQAVNCSNKGEKLI